MANEIQVTDKITIRWKQTLLFLTTLASAIMANVGVLDLSPKYKGIITFVCLTIIGLNRPFAYKE